MMVCAVHIWLQRLWVLLNKAVYVIVSFTTAFKNKKQRLRNQWICVVLQITVLLPYLIGVILITTILETATVPFLGFAFFYIGFPKPQRCWSCITPVTANPKDSCSDGHLFQAMQPQLNAQIKELIRQDPYQFNSDSYYLMKNEKMIILIQVQERGNDFIVFTSKGAELQETTTCHAEENAYINEVMEAVFDRK